MSKKPAAPAKPANNDDFKNSLAALLARPKAAPMGMMGMMGGGGGGGSWQDAVARRKK